MYQTCVLNSWRVGLCNRSVRQIITWQWQLFNTPLLLNNHAQFQNIHGEEMSPIKKVMTQYVHVMLSLCITVYYIEDLTREVISYENETSLRRV